MKKPKIGKTGRISGKRGEVEKPKALRGMLKQTEGYSPKEAVSPGKQAGFLPGGNKRASKARERRLSNVPM